MELLTPHEVSKIIKHSEQTLTLWRKKGIGPAFYKFNRKCLYEKKAIEEFIEQKKLKMDD